MTQWFRVLVALIVLCLMAGCTVPGAPTSESFNDMSENGLMVTGLVSADFHAKEHGMTWWPYVEETNQFLLEPDRGVEVVRSPYDRWSWSGVQFNEKKFIVLSIPPGLYALQSTKRDIYVKSRRADSLVIKIERGKINYIGDYELWFQEIELYFGMPYNPETPFRFEFIGHDMDAVEQALLEYPNVSGEVKMVEPRKVVVD